MLTGARTHLMKGIVASVRAMCKRMHTARCQERGKLLVTMLDAEGWGKVKAMGQTVAAVDPTERRARADT